MNQVTLFLFPHAGGTKYAYEQFRDHISVPVSICAYEFPGRGTRIRESLVRDINVLVEKIYDDIKHRMESQYAFYGHSFGSVVAYLLTKKVYTLGKRLPVQVFVSGRRGPHYYKDAHVERSKYSKPEFLKMLMEMGGLPAEIVGDEFAMDFFEPIIRADFAALEAYRYSKMEKMNIPFTVFLGKEDKSTYEDAVTWQDETTLPVDLHYFEGGHFFVFERAREIVSIIQNKISSS